MVTVNGRHARPNRARSSGDEGQGSGPVLVPFDGSPAATAVLPVARAAAQLWRAPVELLCVTPTSGADASPETPAATYADLSDALVNCLPGDPAEVIARVTAERHCVLLVMSAQGWTADPARPLGHVAEIALRRVECPLLLVSSEGSRRFAAGQQSFQRILVPLDGTPGTAEALTAIEPVASQASVTIDVLHVVRSGNGQPKEQGTLTAPYYLDQPHYEWEAWEREFSARFLDPVRQRPHSLSVAVGRPSLQIVQAAREQDSDLIVLGWKGRLDVGRARTVQAVLRDALCPVLLIRRGRTP